MTRKERLQRAFFGVLAAFNAVLAATCAITAITVIADGVGRWERVLVGLGLAWGAVVLLSNARHFWRRRLALECS